MCGYRGELTPTDLIVRPFAPDGAPSLHPLLFRCFLLFFCHAEDDESRIPAAKKRSAAENFLQKQQKQRRLAVKGTRATPKCVDPGAAGLSVRFRHTS
jgi:hypothetical protein